MKKLFVPLSTAFILFLLTACNSTRLGNYTLNERDAASAIRELLSVGTRGSSYQGAFGKDIILSSIFPENIRKAMSTLNMLGVTSDLDKFTSTLSSAAEKTAAASVPIFESGINNMNVTDAMRLVKSGGSSATDYLKTSVGDSLRRAIKPIMQSTIDEYKLNDEWEALLKPIQSIVGSRFKPDLSGVMAVVVTDAMFRKIAEKEIQVRTDAAARTTPLLQKVFSKSWN